MKNNYENLKKLKKLLMEHKDLFLNWDGLEITLKWDDEISNYRGRMEKENIDTCIWKIKTLWEIANGEWKNTYLEEIK